MTFAGLIKQLVGLINLVIPVLVSLALLAFFVGLAKYVYNSGDAHGHAEGKDLIVWGLVSLFVIMTIWGILTIACQSIFGTACNGGLGGSGGAGSLPALQ